MKIDEINALQTFRQQIERIEKEDSGGACLMELVGHADHIARNMKDDFPWHVGIYTLDSDIEHERQTMKIAISNLTSQLKEAKEFDVRAIKAREEELSKSIAAQSAELNDIKSKLAYTRKG